jgi:hypothetical protein
MLDVDDAGLVSLICDCVSLFLGFVVMGLESAVNNAHHEYRLATTILAHRDQRGQINGKGNESFLARL